MKFLNETSKEGEQLGTETEPRKKWENRDKRENKTGWDTNQKRASKETRPPKETKN